MPTPFQMTDGLFLPPGFARPTPSTVDRSDEGLSWSGKSRMPVTGHFPSILVIVIGGLALSRVIQMRRGW